MIAESGPVVPAIEATGLGKRYGPVVAVESLDLRVTPGESVALFGPNGAGKSTLLQLCATLIRPTAGRLCLFGTNASSSDASALRRRIGFLSHQTFLYEHLTGLENLLFYARLYALPDPASAALEPIRAARLEHRRHDRVGSYSRGMQQRLAIARALMHRPDLLLLDEPFTGLDRPSCARLEATLEEERGAGRTFILATHDFGQGLRTADRVLVLVDGRLTLDRAASGLDPASLEALMTARSSPARATS